MGWLVLWKNLAINQETVYQVQSEICGDIESSIATLWAPWILCFSNITSETLVGPSNLLLEYFQNDKISIMETGAWRKYCPYSQEIWVSFKYYVFWCHVLLGKSLDLSVFQFSHSWKGVTPASSVCHKEQIRQYPAMVFQAFGILDSAREYSKPWWYQL